MERLAVLGLGKVGALAARLLHGAGFAVTGYDARELRQSFPFETETVGLGDADAVTALLTGKDGVLSCLPYSLNKTVATLAHGMGIHYFDLTEDVPTTKHILDLSRNATAVMAPQCGLAPGFVGIVGADLISRFDTCRSCKMRVGALPQHPTGLMGYAFNWSPEGVVNEYLNDCEVIPDFSISVGPLLTVNNSKEWKKAEVELKTSDVFSAHLIEEMVTSITSPESKAKLSWIHSGDSLSHTLVIDSIKRVDNNANVIVQIDGKSIGADKKRKVDIYVPSLKSFENTGVKFNKSPQYIEVSFSDNLDSKQNLKGLVKLSGVPESSLSFKSKKNILKVYTTRKLRGKHTLTLNKSIRNSDGQSLQKAYELSVQIQSDKPQAKFLGKGVILTSGNNNQLAFETINLNAVTLTAFRVFDHNMPQFFQSNRLNEYSQLKRVSRAIWRKKINLSNNSLNHNKWVRYSFQLDSLFNEYPGELFRFKLDFRPDQIDYKCDDDYMDGMPEEESLASLNEIGVKRDRSSWDGYESYYARYNDNWSNKENPCHPAYYNKNFHTTATYRNILSSNLGIIAKQGEDGLLHAFITDMMSSEPINGAVVEVLNYQSHVIGKKWSDLNGMIKIDLEQKPFLIRVKKDRDVGYLKLHDGDALSLSPFNVSGAKIEKGLKAFVYGERGVWRPGDSIYLSVMVENSTGKLPANYPVSLRFINPLGQTVHRDVSSKGLNGVYTFKLKTDQEDPTGKWNAVFKIGGVEFRKTLRIETVKPNRLKINIDFGKELLTSKDNNLNGELSSKWLHGAIASGLKTEVAVKLSAQPTKFETHKDYVFDDVSASFDGKKRVLFEGKLNDKGKVQISGKLSTSSKPKSPGMLKASFTTKVFEQGGSFSIDQFSIPFSPHQNYVGMKLPKGDVARGMLLTDTNHKVMLVSMNESGEINRKQTKYRLEVFKLNWRWWWDRTRDNIARYMSNYGLTPVVQKEGSFQGEGSEEFKIAYPAWGRYLIRTCDLRGGHCASAIKYIDWPGWAGRARKDGDAGVQMLSFNADKKSYNVGDTASITIPTPEQGRILISVEDGQGILNSFWAGTQIGNTVIRIPLTNEYTPTAYISALLIQPHSQTDNSRPMRMFGVIPVKVVNPTTVLNPTITTPEYFQPSSTGEVAVSEGSGRDMTYTLAVVDEGLLDLTRFKTPDPWNHFYAKEALGVKTWDLYKYVIGAEKFEIEKFFSIGGDGGSNREKKNSKANRFPPMVKFYGPFYLKKGETNHHEIDVPEYIGSVRTMVVAAQDNGNYGSVDKAVPVKSPLMVMGTLPRVMGPGEKVKLPVTLFVMDEAIKSVELEIEASNHFRDTILKKQVSISKVGEQVIWLDMETLDETGIAKVKINASSNSAEAVHTIELDVRAPNARKTVVKNVMIKPGESWMDSVDVPGVKEERQAVLELSRMPSINLDRRLKYLTRYPHGCIEQTTSSVFPQLYLGQLEELDDAGKKVLQTNVKAGIERLSKFQTSSGGFAYWPGNSGINDWGSNYAGHFLIEARKNGYYVPDPLFNKWKAYQKTQATKWRDDNKRNIYQAYRLFTLALANAAEVGAMNRLKENKNLDDRSKWYLASAYYLIGQKEAAESLIKGLSFKMGQYRELGFTYGSSTRDEAIILHSLVLMDKKEEAKSVLDALAKKLSSGRWMSTQETAYALMAIAEFSGTKAGGTILDLNVEETGYKELAIKTDKNIVKKILHVRDDGKSKWNIQNNSTTEAFVSLISTYVPLVDDGVAESKGLTMEVSYKNQKGVLIDPVKLTQGQEFTVELTITNPTNRMYEELSLTTIFPSGWEIQNERLNNETDTKGKWEYQDIRDDRVYTYFDLRRRNSLKLSFTLNASYAGKFYLPAFVAEAMYDNTIIARNQGKWVQVLRNNP